MTELMIGKESTTSKRLRVAQQRSVIEDDLPQNSTIQLSTTRRLFVVSTENRSSGSPIHHRSTQRNIKNNQR